MTSILLIFVSTIFACAHCELMRIRACEGHTMKLFCSHNEIINVNWANYGRTDDTFCHYFEDIEANEDCRIEGATDIVKQTCDGKRKCFVDATNQIFGDPCPGQVKYVEATYDCVPKPLKNLDPNDLTVKKQEGELLEIFKDLGEKDSNGEDLNPKQALGLLNLFANAEAETENEEENTPQISK